MVIVDSRPLIVDNLNSPDNLEPLTPNHLVQMISSTALPPPGNFPKEDLYGVKRWRRVQHLAEQFWSAGNGNIFTTLLQGSVGMCQREIFKWVMLLWTLMSYSLEVNGDLQGSWRLSVVRIDS